MNIFRLSMLPVVVALMTATLSAQDDTAPTPRVSALVSVQRPDTAAANAKQPVVRFVSVDGDIPAVLATLTPISRTELESMGLANAATSHWLWYRAAPSTPLTGTKYRVEAELNGYQSAQTEASEVAADSATLFDIVLKPAIPAEPADPMPLPASDGRKLHGRVYGEGPAGENAGPIANASVELLNGDEVIASTQSDATGYYVFPAIKQSEFTYRIAAAGYQAQDAENGVRLPARASANALNFVLSQTVLQPAAQGTLSGRVQLRVSDEDAAVTGAAVAVRNTATGQVVATQASSDGEYSLNLAAGEWRASAVVSGFDPQIHKGNVTIAAGADVSLDFLFEREGEEERPDVYVLVAVQAASEESIADAIPVVRFVDVNAADGEPPVQGETKLLSPEELARIGQTVSSSRVGYWKWFKSRPKQPLSAGRYRVAGELEGYHSAHDEKSLSEFASTVFDLTLRPQIPVEPLNVVTPDEPVLPPLHGRVSAQDRSGAHLGMLGGVTIKLVDSAGQFVAATVTGSGGFYSLTNIDSGEFRYQISQDGFEPENQAFSIASNNDDRRLDIVLTVEGEAPIEPEPLPSVLGGTVYSLNEDGGKLPLPNAVVALRKSLAETRLLRTDPQGRYQITLSTGQWRAFAEAPGYVKSALETPITIVAGQDASQDFTLSIAQRPMERTRAFAIVVVEQMEVPAGTESERPLIQFTSVGEGPMIEVVGVVRSLVELQRDPAVYQSLGFEIEAPEEGWEIFLAAPAAPLPIGSFRVEVDSPRHYPEESEVRQVRTGAITLFDVALEMMIPRVNVLVRSKDGTPIEGAQARFMNRSLNRRLADATSIETGEDGTESAELLDGVGTYNVLLTGAGIQSQGRELEVHASEMDVEFEVYREGETRTGDLAAVVMCTEEDEPIPGATVQLSAVGAAFLPPEMRRPLTSNEQGEIIQAGLVEGDYKVIIRSEGYTTSTQMIRVTAVPGEPTVLNLSPRNTELDNALVKILTVGWGRNPEATAAAAKWFDVAVTTAPEDPRADYVYGLALLYAASFETANERLEAAIMDLTPDFVWDRSVEVRIWLLMHLSLYDEAIEEMTTLAVNFYPERNVNHASVDAARMMGAAIGFLLEQTLEGVTPAAVEETDRKIKLALTGDHLNAYMRGLGEAQEAVGEVADELQDAATRQQADTARRDADRASRANTRLGEIDRRLQELQRLAVDAQKLTATRSARLDADARAINTKRQRLAREAEPLVADREEIRTCHREDTNELPGIEDLAIRNEILEEIREHERDLLIIGTQLNDLNALDRTLAQNFARLEKEFNRARAEYQQLLRDLEAERQALLRERQSLGAMGGTQNGQPARITPVERLEDRLQSFNSFEKYPIDLRRTEQLDSLRQQ